MKRLTILLLVAVFTTSAHADAHSDDCGASDLQAAGATLAALRCIITEALAGSGDYATAILGDAEVHVIEGRYFVVAPVDRRRQQVYVASGHTINAANLPPAFAERLVMLTPDGIVYDPDWNASGNRYLACEQPDMSKDDLVGVAEGNRDFSWNGFCWDTNANNNERSLGLVYAANEDDEPQYDRGLVQRVWFVPSKLCGWRGGDRTLDNLDGIMRSEGIAVVRSDEDCPR